MMNATVTGHLGSDAETKQVGSDSVTTFSVASSRKTKDGEETTWVRANLWGKRGESLRQYLTKGSSVTIVGELTLREYTKDGVTKSSLDMRVADIALQGGNRSERAPSAQAPRTQQRQAPAPEYSDPGDLPF